MRLAYGTRLLGSLVSLSLLFFYSGNIPFIRPLNNNDVTSFPSLASSAASRVWKCQENNLLKCHIVTETIVFLAIVWVV